DFKNDVEMARQNALHQIDRPLFEGFGHQRVIRVSADRLGQGPGLVPVEFIVVDENSHDLNDRESGMRIVELDGYLVRKVVEVGMMFEVTAEDVVNGARDEKILLKQS